MVESAAHVEHVFAADELFFSTTDSHGRIRRANSTFMRLSGYPRGALVGRAHNVVRHADMPAGLFRSIWDAIEEGRAASAYITNRSSDDGHYRVFATIVPSGSGYLSVRTLPMLTDLRDQVEAAYARAVADDDGERDTVAAADALADLVYVVYGMALETGIDLAAVLAEVQRSNMSKLGADGRPVYREDGKVLKGPGYFPPDVAGVLGIGS